MSSPAVLFTGFPGFLGSALLERVLARGDGPVACLVQPEYRQLAERRVDTIVERLDGLDSDDAVRLYDGDITEPDLGLGEARETLTTVCEVYHLAAVYDLGVDAAVAEAVNVGGTEHVLDFAEAAGIDHLHYVSTCYVSGRYDGIFTEDNLREGQQFNNHYERTKYEAEVAVQDRMQEGLPATVYRPAIVVGDSETGETDKFDGPYNLIRMLLAQPQWLSAAFTFTRSGEAEMNVVPRDFVVDAIAYLSDRQAAVGEVYQLCDPTPLPVEQFVDIVGAAVGHRTVTIPTAKPLATATVRAFDHEWLDIDADTLDYLDHPTRYACPNTQRGLAGSGIAVPPFESYVETLVEFVRENPEISGEPMA